MEGNNNYLRPILFIGALIVVLGLALYFYPRGFGSMRWPTTATLTKQVATSTSMLGTSTKQALGTPTTKTITSQAGQAGVNWNTVAMPSLTRPVQYSSMVTGDVRAMVAEKISLQRAVLINGADTDEKVKQAWLNLALFYTYARDFAAATEVWKYVVAVMPRDVAAYNYLGNAYRNDLRDFPNAEAWYLKSLEVNKNQKDVYAELFYLYSIQYKTDTSAALDILNRALAQYPGDEAFTKALADYKAGKK